MELAPERGRAAVRYAPGEIEVAAPVAGQGALVGLVDARSRAALRGAVARRGSVALVLPGRRGETVVVDAGPGEAIAPAPAGAGQGWIARPGGRWLVTAATVPGTGFLLRLSVPAHTVEGALSASFRRLLALLAGLTAASVLAGVVLTRLAVRRERTELELARARELAAMGKTSAAIAH